MYNDGAILGILFGVIGIAIALFVVVAIFCFLLDNLRMIAILVIFFISSFLSGLLVYFVFLKFLGASPILSGIFAFILGIFCGLVVSGTVIQSKSWKDSEQSSRNSSCGWSDGGGCY